MACNSEIVIPNPRKPAVAVIKAADEVCSITQLLSKSCMFINYEPAICKCLLQVKKQLEDLVGCKFAIYEVKSYREYVKGATTYYFIQVCPN